MYEEEGPQAHLIAEVLVRPLAPLPALTLAQTAIDHDGLARGHVIHEERLRREIRVAHLSNLWGG